MTNVKPKLLSTHLKEYVDQNWHIRKGRIINESDKRKWLKAIPKDSYDDKHYRVELWILKGSPVKQIVVINHCMKQMVVMFV